MTNWKPGMKAVCVEALPLPYQTMKVGGVYTVFGVHACQHSALVLDTGAISTMPNSSGYTRLPCGCRIQGNWKDARRFRPLLGDEQCELDTIEEEVKEAELITDWSCASNH